MVSINLLTTSKKTFFKEHFTGLNYTSQQIKNLEFEDCTFEKCIFIECRLDNCIFTDCTFSECSISATKPFNSKFSTVTFKNSKVMGFDWTKAKSIKDLTFERCDISYSNFSFLKVHNLKLVESVAVEVSFNEADLTGSIFTETDFSKTIFSNTNLTNTDFRKAFNYGIDFNFNMLKKAKFSLPEAASLLKSLDIVLEE